MDNFNLFRQRPHPQPLDAHHILLAPLPPSKTHQLHLRILPEPRIHHRPSLNARPVEPPIESPPPRFKQQFSSQKQTQLSEIADRTMHTNDLQQSGKLSVHRSSRLAESLPAKSERSKLIHNTRKPAMEDKIALIKNKCLSNFKKKEKQTMKVQGKTEDDEAQSVDMESGSEVNLRHSLLLLQSPYEGRPTTLFFQYPKCCQIQRSTARAVPGTTRQPLKYRMAGSEYRCIVNSLEVNNFVRDDDQWNVFFDITGTKMKSIESMNRFQKMNHFPGCWYLGRKDFLYKVVVKMRRKFPLQFNFIPMTYLFPVDYQRFQTIREAADKQHLWIMKPVNSACGRGIKIITKESKIKKKQNMLASQYIRNPHLINGLKYDLRLYVLVSSYDPLRVYLFEQGLVRLATYQYSTKLKQASKRFVHLTNYSVNKASKKFIKGEEDGRGSKWSHTYYKSWLKQKGHDPQAIFASIKDIIIKTCIAAEPNMMDLAAKSLERRACCFQLYGFDVLLDDTMRPWLMEVNVCPSLASSATLDRRIKHMLITDSLHLIGLRDYDRKDYQDQKKKEREAIATGTGSKKQIFSKNVKDLEGLSYDNCVERLKLEDWNVLFQTEEEDERRGHYELIYPRKDNVGRYLPLFQFQRYNNVLLGKFLQSERNYLEQVAKRRSV